MQPLRKTFSGKARIRHYGRNYHSLSVSTSIQHLIPVLTLRLNCWQAATNNQHHSKLTEAGFQVGSTFRQHADLMYVPRLSGFLCKNMHV